MMERLKFLEKQREEEDRRHALDETQKEELEQYEDALRKQLIRVAEQAQETERLIEKAEDKMGVLTPEQQKLYEELEEQWEEEHALRQQRIRGHEQQLKALRTSLDLVRMNVPVHMAYSVLFFLLQYDTWNLFIVDGKGEGRAADFFFSTPVVPVHIYR